MKSDWVEVPLGEVVTLNYGKALAKKDRNPKGSIPIYGANGVMDWSDHTLTEGPSIVVGRKGSAGETTLVNGPFWPSDVTYFTSHDESRLDFGFMHYQLKALNLPSMARGVKPGINRNDVYALKIPLPPLEEQQRIVAVLDEAFEGLAHARTHAEANLQNARELFESYRDRLIGIGAEDWEENTLGNYLGGITYGFTNPMPNADEGPIKVTAKNVKNGEIYFAGARHTTPEAFSDLLTDKSRPKLGDVLLTKDGTLGRTAVVEMEGICVNQSVAVLTPTDQILPKYLQEMLSCRVNQDAMIADAGGATIKHLYITRVPKIIVHVPSLDEQSSLLEALSVFKAAVSDLIANAEAKLQDLDDLRQSLLQKAFSGELT